MPKARPAAPAGAALRTSMSREGAITPPRKPAVAIAAVKQDGRQRDGCDHQHDGGIDGEADGRRPVRGARCGRRESRRRARRPRSRRDRPSARCWRSNTTRHSRSSAPPRRNCRCPALDRPSSMKKIVSTISAGVMMPCRGVFAPAPCRSDGAGVGNTGQHQQQRHQRTNGARHDQRAEAADGRDQRRHDRGRHRAAEEAGKGVDREGAAHPRFVHMGRQDRVIGRMIDAVGETQAARRLRSARR